MPILKRMLIESSESKQEKNTKIDMFRLNCKMLYIFIFPLWSHLPKHSPKPPVSFPRGIPTKEPFWSGSILQRSLRLQDWELSYKQTTKCLFRKDVFQTKVTNSMDNFSTNLYIFVWDVFSECLPCIPSFGWLPAFERHLDVTHNPRGQFCWCIASIFTDRGGGVVCLILAYIGFRWI